MNKKHIYTILIASLLVACGDNESSTNQKLNIKKDECVKTELCGTYDKESSSYVGTKRFNYTFSPSAGGERSFVITFPKNYDPNLKYKLALVFAGTDTTGKEMQEWFGKGWSDQVKGLEQQMEDTIFIYPDQLSEWKFNSNLVKGWVLGPNADRYSGNQDIQFTKELLHYAKTHYSIDPKRVFATGHSWGGDMTAVVGCFLGDEFTAIVPVAANHPYWFYDNKNNAVGCKGKPAVWTLFGLKDDHFNKVENGISINGDFGKQQNDFWLNNHGCNKSRKTQSNETTYYTQCTVSPVILTLYDGGQYSGGGNLNNHAPPDYYLKEIPSWFSGF
ncbi:alpha/beta hydrolase family esterase [Acinetobacter sp. YK3]|uniref:alpha/beta hydrolase family esterase n=1 Tax=Acinetobacter sp. YK3 TaxID=1860097 RepID=UPI00084C76DA|nr:alpha/beta hydrolase-fold protein [Acinetobacter sp. YK3]OEC91454.1 hypothetical protein A9Z07_17035 [Acinetobacter sp. YK3]